MAELRLILNGRQAANQTVREAVSALREQGHQVSVRLTWEDGDAAWMAAEAAREGVSRVIAGGGDGTINEVLNGLLDAQLDSLPDLAILPLGTANDFATGCGISTDIHQALQLAASGETRRVDVGRAAGRYFINVASIGIGARITAETPAALKQFLGGGAYVLNGLLSVARQTSRRMRLSGPDWEIEDAVILGAVANGRLAGGGFSVAPVARLDDGLLDVLVLAEFPWVEIDAVRQELDKPDAAENRFVRYCQTPWVEMSVLDGGEDLINVDGEPLSVRELRFELASRQLSLVLPPDMPLSS